MTFSVILELRFVGRLFVKALGKPTEILTKLNEMAGFPPNEEIELYEVSLLLTEFLVVFVLYFIRALVLVFILVLVLIVVVVVVCLLLLFGGRNHEMFPLVLEL